MRKLKVLFSTLVVTATLSGMAFAAEVGVVDIQEISQKYSKAQELATQVKSKETELQKLRDSLVAELKAADEKKMSPVEKKNLEDKLKGQFAAKFKEYREWTMTQEQAIKSDFDRAIQAVAKNQSLDIVLPSQAVLQGGRDITADVITQLNTAK